MISNSIESHDADNIINSINNLIHINDKDKYRYLNALLNPEKSKNIKMPSKIPIPSCTFQLHETKILSGNNFRIMFNPFFLYDKRVIDIPDYYDTFYGPYGEENYGRIDSSEFIGFYKPIFFTTLVEIFKELSWREDSIQTRYIDINQGLPHLYSKYRLVSASITVKYVGSMETSNGIIGGAIITEDNNYVSSHMEMIVDDGTIEGASQNRMFYKYYDYNLVLNSLYHQQNKCIDGIRLIYFPLDNSYEEFVDVFTPKNVKETGFTLNYQGAENAYLIGDKNFKNAFNFYIYILNDFGSDIQNKYKLDVNSKEFIQDKQYDFGTKLLKQNDEEIKQEEKKDDEEMKQEEEIKEEEKKDEEEIKQEEKKDDEEMKQEEEIKEEKKDDEEMKEEKKDNEEIK